MLDEKGIWAEAVKSRVPSNGLDMGCSKEWMKDAIWLSGIHSQMGKLFWDGEHWKKILFKWNIVSLLLGVLSSRNR